MFGTSIIETVIVENLLWLTEKYLIDYTGDIITRVTCDNRIHRIREVFQSTTVSMENIGILKMNLSTKDPGNQRFRMRSDFTQKIMEKY